MIHGATGKRERRIVTGDSLYAQSPTMVHFGLGDETRVEKIVVGWPDGEMQEVVAPAINQYHNVTAQAP